MSRVIVYGSMNMDTVVNVAQFPLPGQTIHALDSGTGPGGKGLNQAVAAARMGGATVMVGAAGSDAAGAQLRQALAAETGLDVSHLRTADVATGQALVTVDATSENNIVIIAGANATHTPESAAADLAFAGPGDVLVCQLEIPRAATAAALAGGRARGLFTILNAAPAAPVTDLLGDVDLLVVNETEALEILGEDCALDLLASTLYERTGTGVVVTLGADGVLFHTGEHSGVLAAYPVTSVDTTGAGDAFVGAMATFLAERRALPQALRLAAILGALACTVTGAQGYTERRAQVLALA